MPANLACYRADYDRHERAQLEIAGFDREDAGHVVRHIPHKGDYGFISYVKHEDFDLSAEIAAQVEACRGRCQVLEWKVYSHDPSHPQSFAALEAAGFTVGEEEFLLCYDLAEHAPKDKRYRELDLRCLATEADIDAAVAVQNTVFGTASAVSSDRLIANQQQRRADPNVAIDDLYAVYVGGEPVAVSRLSYHPASPFAGMWGGGTLESHRGKGYYTAMVHARADEAIKLGKKYLIIEAADTSKPIVERLGFKLLGSTWPCEKVLV